MKGRIVLEFKPNLQAEIENVAEKQEVSRAEIIKQAIVIYLILLKEVEKNENRRVAIVEGDKIIEKILLR